MPIMPMLVLCRHLHRLGAWFRHTSDKQPELIPLRLHDTTNMAMREEAATQTADRALLIKAEKIRTHYRGMLASFIGITIVATVVGVALPPLANPFLVPAWVGSVYMLSFIRYLLWRSYHRKNPPPQDARRWGIYATIVFALSGVTWGVGNIILYPPGQIEYQLLLLFVSLGAAMGALIGQITYMPTFYFFTYPLFLLSAGSFLREPDAIHIAFSTLMIVYLLVGTRLAQSLHQSYSESISLRFENIDLIENLKQQKEFAEQARQMAEAANIAKSRFLAAASHDLRQPLHAMGLFVQALEESDLPIDERTTLGNVRRSVDAMEELFNALLDVSKLDAGVVSVHLATVPLQPFIERVVSQYRALAGTKGLKLRVRGTQEFVLTDPILLERILRNLVSNAVLHTPRGAVLVACRRRGESVRIEVWDTGPGIPADQREVIFHEFTQLGNPERDRRKGLGLGLAIVERLCKLLHHPLTLYSQVGRGSVFAVSLPRGEAYDFMPWTATVRADIGTHDLTGRLVLVVDDEVAVQEGMHALLVKWGCDVLCAGSAAEVIEKLSGLVRVPDLVICDYRLRNEENGIEVIGQLRQEFNIDLPAFLITGDTGPKHLREAVASGLPILHKPLNPARLRTLMVNVLGNAESRVQD